jgi:hypothetical protein
MPLHEAWRAIYRQQRYLAGLNVDELMEHGRRVIAELRPHFLVGEARSGDSLTIMHKWTDFMEECQLRNLDMRQFRTAST